MHVRLTFARTGIALRVVLMVLFAGGIAPWLTLQTWDLLPPSWNDHRVVGAGLARALMTLGLAWAIFPEAHRRPSGCAGRHKFKVLLPLIIAVTAILARVGALAAAPNTHAFWHGFTWTQLGYVTAFGVGTAVFEEVLFRFVLLDRLAEVVGTPIAFTIQLGLFSALHLYVGPVEIGQLLHAAFAGGVLSLIYLQTRSLWPVIALHFAYNVLSGAIFGIAIDGVQLYPMLAGDNFGKAHGRLAAATAFACWAVFFAIQSYRSPRQPSSAGIAHG